MRRVALLGSTGSIGRQTIDVVERLRGRLQITALAAGTRHALLAEQTRATGASAVTIADPDCYDALISDLPRCVSCVEGDDALQQLATRDDVDVVVVAISGAIAARATIAALEAGKDVAIATKEVLVAAGRLVREAAARGGGNLLPIDSEHSAIFQCLQGEKPENVKALWLTASGGPFRRTSLADLDNVTAADALMHPTWSMGPKVTVDSATLMNKGLESIEARWLFDIPIERVEVVVHPQSIIHSMVEMVDGTLLAQMGKTDMRLPIAYALTYPDRVDLGDSALHCDPRTLRDFTFEAPDLTRFRCLGLARQADRLGGAMPAIMNAANESAVQLFLDGKISFLGIADAIEQAMDASSSKQFTSEPNLDQIIEADQWARGFVAAHALGLALALQQ